MSHPWMPFYVADYLSATNHLSAQQHGGYLLLIMHYWQKGHLPDDNSQLARIARMTDREWASSRSIIQAFFVDGWRHARVETELAKADEKNTRRVEAGKAGGFAKQNGSKRGSNGTSNASSNALASSSHPPEDTSLRSVSPRSARKPKSVRSRIAEDAQPTTADRDHATSIGMTSDVFRFEWGRFRDHHLKVASMFASWPAAWRTWCANWLERGGSKSARAGPTARSADGLDEARRMLRTRHEPDYPPSPNGSTELADPGDVRPRQGAYEPARDDPGGQLLDFVPVRSHAGTTWRS